MLRYITGIALWYRLHEVHHSDELLIGCHSYNRKINTLFLIDAYHYRLLLISSMWC